MTSTIPAGPAPAPPGVQAPSGQAPPGAAVAADAGTPIALASVGRSAGLLAMAAALGQVFAFVRELFVAGELGASARYDGLLVALVLPTIVAGLLAGGPGAALVPAFRRLERDDGLPAAKRFSGALFTWIFIAATMAMLLIWAADEWIAFLTGPGLHADGHAAAVEVTPIVAPMVVFLALSGVLTALCQTREAFAWIALGWLIGPVVSLVVTVTAWDRLDVEALALGLTVGSAATFLMVLIGAWRVGVAPRLRLRPPRDAHSGFLRHAGPLTAGSAILQANLFGDRAVASLLSVGSVSALRYGEGLLRGPMGAIAPAWSTALYPALIKANDREDGGIGAASDRAIRYVLAVFVPVAVFAAVMAPWIVDVAFRRGNFDAEDAAVTSTVVAAFAPLVVLTIIQAVIVGAHNARQSGLLLMTAGFANAGLNLVFDVIFGVAFGVAGVAVSTSVTILVVLTFLGLRLGRADPAFSWGRLMRYGMRLTLIALVPGIPLALLGWGVDIAGAPLLARLVALAMTFAGLALAYVVIARWLRVPEVVTSIDGARALLAERVVPRLRGVAGRRT